MSIVTLLTDFGIEDAYVGTMKGVILSVNPSAVIIDITHHVEPQNIIQAAYIISSYYRYFPKKTVHIIVVDPGVGSDRDIIAVNARGNIFLAPDNGVLTLLIDEGKVDTIVRIENTRFFLKPVSQTFHGRDIFAPIGAHISKGIDIKALGPPLEQKDLVHFRISKPYVTAKGALVGEIVSVDRFGNCITNIDENCLAKLYRTAQDERLEIIIGDKRIHGVSHSYFNAEPQNPLAVMGSFGYLEIALNHGNARNYFNTKIGDTIRLVLKQKLDDAKSTKTFA
ncbi:MAG: SAM-dependent chlorinase/fluorinase [Desulfobacterales bacterium]|nr:MAG: SAM-dependent chlorinase/fluorinase [Desulfobacterales bacterium]